MWRQWGRVVLMEVHRQLEEGDTVVRKLSLTMPGSDQENWQSLNKCGILPVREGAGSMGSRRPTRFWPRRMALGVGGAEERASQDFAGHRASFPVTAAVRVERPGGASMHVVAVSIPTRPDWCWRIVNSAGEIIEESRQAYPSIARAVAEGRVRLGQMDVVDRSVPARPRRTTSHLRGR